MPLLEVNDLRVWFPVLGGLMRRKVDEIKAGTDRVEAKATLAIEEAKAARHLAKLARAAADAATDVTA